MGEIYAAASEVQIWLGDDEDALVAGWRQYFVRTYIDSQPNTPLRTFIPPAIAERMPYQRAIIAIVQSILYRPWYTRVWVVQEMVMAQKVVFHCGQSTFSMETLGRLNARLQVDSEFKQMMWDHGEDFRFPGGSHQLTVIDWMRRNRFSQEGLLNSEDLVTFQEFRSLQCSDPRDRVYGLLNLTSLSSLTDIDYRKPVEEVYYDAAVASLERSSSLHILYCAGLRETATGEAAYALRSWIPDWRQAADNNRGPSEVIAWWQAERCYNAYDAAMWDGATHGFVADKTLIVVGCLADQVTCVLDIARDVDEADDDWEDEPGMQSFRRKRLIWILRQWREALYDVPEDIFWRVALRDITIDEPEINRPRRLTEEDVRQLIYDAIEGEPPFEGSLDSVYRSKIFSRMESYLPCRTVQGRVGQVPRGSQHGDRIVILHGTRVPFVLRYVEDDVNEDNFMIVGPCYVHGIMDGEIIEAIKAAKGLGQDCRPPDVFHQIRIV